MFQLVLAGFTTPPAAGGASMICDELSEGEIYQAYLIYASLHGMKTDEESVRERISDYLERNTPDELIDDAILAYAEDCIIAPPDVVLAQWGSSRFYELEHVAQHVTRHKTCESWFENGCRFLSDDDTPRLVHFWTAVELAGACRAEELHRGTRLRLLLVPDGTVNVVHRQRGCLGNLSDVLAEALHEPTMRKRKYLALVDNEDMTEISGGSQRREAQTDPTAFTCKLLVISGSEEVATDEIVSYAADAFLADRNKC